MDEIREVIDEPPTSDAILQAGRCTIREVVIRSMGLSTLARDFPADCPRLLISQRWTPRGEVERCEMRTAEHKG